MTKFPLDNPQNAITFTVYDGRTHIATMIRRLEKHVNMNSKHWNGSDEEFLEWAEESMGQLLALMRGQVGYLRQSEENQIKKRPGGYRKSRPARRNQTLHR